jgi:hypothetical protein
MTDPRKTATNAADSAPGVDDGRDGVRPPSVNSKPGGRNIVFLVVAVALVVLAVAFLYKPPPSRSAGDDVISPGTTAAEVAASDAPGAQPSGTH